MKRECSLLLEAETICHILWQCPSAQDVWSVGGKTFQKSSFFGDDFLQIAKSMLRKCEGQDFQLFVSIARKIWKRRNDFIREGVFLHPRW
jgi:hypothetical protein